MALRVGASTSPVPCRPPRHPRTRCSSILRPDVGLLAVTSRFQSIWTMIGLAIRIAEAMGLHRDGEIFPLPALETKLRRRLWWQIYMLDQGNRKAWI
jgi:hypothetical protein